MPAKGTRTRKRSEHYVNNKEFLYAIVQYKADVKEAEEKGDPKPVSYTHLTLPTSDLV